MLIAPQLRHWIRSSILKSRPRRRKPRDTASRFIARRKLGSPELLEDRTLLAAALVGVDFGDLTADDVPTNWSSARDIRNPGGGNGVDEQNLPRENGAPTDIDLTVATNSFANSSFEGQANGATVNAATVPIHTNSLALTDGFVLNFDLAGVITAT